MTKFNDDDNTTDDVDETTLYHVITVDDYKTNYDDDTTSYA